MSPRRFDRRTYMIVAAGWSALAFKTAMSASSASTTIRSAFPFTLSPTVNCHDIFGLPQSYVTNERSPASTDTLSASSISLCRGVVASRRAQRAPLMHKRVGRTLAQGASHATWSAPRALHVLALVNNGARLSQMAIQSPQHK